MLGTRKILPTMMDETDIDDGGRPEAAVNEGNELKHSRLLGSPLRRMRKTMVLVPFSRDTIYKSCGLRKQIHRNDENRQFITVKYVFDHPKWVDDDRTDWTMKTTTRNKRCKSALYYSMRIQ